MAANNNNAARAITTTTPHDSGALDALRDEHTENSKNDDYNQQEVWWRE